MGQHKQQRERERGVSEGERIGSAVASISCFLMGAKDRQTLAGVCVMPFAVLSVDE